MKIHQFIFLFFLIICCHYDLFSQKSLYKNSIPIAELQQDYDLLKKVLLNYHPGLYRFQDSITVAHHFEELKKELNHDLSATEFYLILSRFTAKLKCGHTFASYYNQKKEIQDSIFNLSDKVPFTFSLFKKQMILDKNLSEKKLKAGSQIISINQIPVTSIIDSLLLYAKGDGSNDGKRLSDLALTGLGEFEAFDIYFPLLFPPINATYELALKEIGTDTLQQVTVNCISRKERFNLMEKKYGKQLTTLDELWEFKLLNKKTAYLKLGTFVTYKMTLNWKKFLKTAFDEIRSKNIPNLIIDIRDNEGGMDEVNLELAKHLASQPIAMMQRKELLTYEKVTDDVRPYLKTWDKRFYNGEGKLVKLNNGFYTWKKERKSKLIKQNKNAFKGNVFLLVNEANSSATFFLTGTLQQNKRATIIGTETGGNRKGTNGGFLFFLRLPNSNLEIDIPLIGYYPFTEQPDKGLTPDILITPTLENIINKKDLGLEKALYLINQNGLEKQAVRDEDD